jgi:hypothetical protein
MIVCLQPMVAKAIVPIVIRVLHVLSNGQQYTIPNHHRKDVKHDSRCYVCSVRRVHT